MLKRRRTRNHFSKSIVPIFFSSQNQGDELFSELQLGPEIFSIQFMSSICFNLYTGGFWFQLEFNCKFILKIEAIVCGGGIHL